MQTMAINIFLWFAQIALRAALKRVSATFGDALKPVAGELVAASEKTATKWDDKVAGFFAKTVGAE